MTTNETYTRDSDVYNFEVSSIYGAKTKQGIVVVNWNGKEEQLSILNAKKIAYMILEASEAAATDQALMKFLTETLSLPLEQAASALGLLRESRGKQDPRFFED